MNTYIPAPTHQLPKDSIKVMILKEIIGLVVTLGVLGGLFALHSYFSWPVWSWWALMGGVILSVCLTVPSLFTPFLQYKNTRYGVTEEFLLIKTGALKRTDQLIPMAKIQTVSTQQGIMMRKYNMMSVAIQTTGSHHLMPYLHEEEARNLRNQIAHYAKIEEVEED